uniref:Glutathione S-transferase-like n=1 Tax=Crassostrea virginica TaxID=6565 RepID=A0A8B8EDM6_CRAVI|nr:glutathione S-transferase-like [Crassostrea virginica]
MPKFVFHYFDARGRGEPARLLFAVAGIPFQDRRVSQEEWPNLKPKIPGGTLPYLEVDGAGFTQSLVIFRHLARLFGLDGDTVLDKAHVEEITEYLVEIKIKFFEGLGFPPDNDEEKLKKLKEEFLTKLHSACSQIDRILGTNKSTEGWAVGKKLTFADIMMFEVFEHVLSSIPEALDKYPRIQKSRKKVQSLKKLQEYLSKRKVTAF